MKPITSIDDPRYVKAMSHPLRVRILALLSERTASPVELAEWVEATLGTVAYHVRTLHRLGLIELVDETRVRGAVEHHYRARERPHVSDDAWSQAAPIAKQAAVGSSLQVIDEYVRTSAAAGGFDRADSHLHREMLKLDAQGWRELAEAGRRMLGEAERISKDAAKRLKKAPDDDGNVEAGFVVMLFEAARLAQPSDGDGGRSTKRRAKAAAK
jgi:DNA-binding transcriptional ArsR family regulator